MENIADAIVLKNNKLLTIKRLTEPWPGMYGLPGGHIKEKEDRIEALKREIKEETGFEIEVNESDFLGTEDFKYKSRRFKVLFYKARITKGEKKPQEEEIEEVKWLSLEEFVQNLEEFGFSFSEIKKISNFAKLAGCHL